MTVRQAADRLEVSQSLVYGLIASGKLKHYRIGKGRGCIRIADEHVVEFLRGAEPVVLTPPVPASRFKPKHLHQ